MAPRLPDPDTTPSPRLTLRLLATTDLHGHLLPWDDLTGRPTPSRSLAAVASLIDAARRECPDAVLLDNGDFLNGSPLSDHLAETWAEGQPLAHPVIAAMNRLGYDAATLGNHEFSHGLPLLEAALAQAAFPVVTSNLFRTGPKDRTPYLPEVVLLDRSLADAAGKQHRLRLGILGFLPPQTAQWEQLSFAGRFSTESILTAATRAERQARAAGADVVIALSHSGLGAAEGPECAENHSLGLAGLPGIDAVISGHIHGTYCSAETETGRAPIILPGFFGSHLGVMDLLLEQTGAGWRVAGHRCELRAVANRDPETGALTQITPPREDITALAKVDQAALAARGETVIAETRVPLTSHLALIGPSAIQSLLAEMQIAHLRPMLDGRPEADLPVLAAVAPFKAGGRGGAENYTAIPQGPLTLRHVADLYLHPNTGVALVLTGAEIALWLERAASLFHQVTPGGRDLPLVNPSFPAYNFDMIHGLDYEVDLSQPARFDTNGGEISPQARRIGGLSFQGRKVGPKDRFVVATNSYRTSGGQGFAGADAAHIVAQGTQPLRQALRDHLARKGAVAPVSTPGWRFAPMPGTTVWFDSAPEAEAQARATGLEVIGPQNSGFLRFRLKL